MKLFKIYKNKNTEVTFEFPGIWKSSAIMSKKNKDGSLTVSFKVEKE